MTYEMGTATDLEDLLSKLDTFAVTTHGGWTRGYPSNPQTTDGWFEVHKGSLSASMKYPIVETPQHMSIHQAAAYIGTSTAPGAHTDDSGNGYNTGTTGHTNLNLNGERCVQDIGNGPFLSYHFFADDTTDDYIHVVVQPVAGRFRHFGFGKFVPFGNNWGGGEYAYGQRMNNATNAQPTNIQHEALFDGLTNNSSEFQHATVRIVNNLLNQGAATWAICRARSDVDELDTDGKIRQRFHGGYRAGVEARGFGNITASTSSGTISLYSISAYYRDPNNTRVQLLGYLPDVRGLNNRNFNDEQEVTVGVDTWIIFPMSIKTEANVEFRSAFSGIAYKKVT